MTVFVIWVTFGALMAAAYAGLLLLLRTRIQSWAFVVGPVGFLAFFASLIYYDVAVQDDHIPAPALMILSIICLLWASAPAFVLYRITKRPEHTPALKQVGYAVGAFYVVTVVAMVVGGALALAFHLPVMP
jgi:hypothetical protein